MFFFNQDKTSQKLNRVSTGGPGKSGKALNYKKLLARPWEVLIEFCYSGLENPWKL